MALNLNDIKKRTQENKEKKVSIDPRSYSYLVYSLPDGGKTSLVSGMFEGKHLMLATEYGAKACLCANEIEVASFKDLKEMSKAISEIKWHNLKGNHRSDLVGKILDWEYSRKKTNE